MNMSDDVFVYQLEITLEFQRGRWIGYHLRASSPRSDFLFPSESSSEDILIPPNVRQLTDWVRSQVHEIQETEWYEVR